ncbi:bifunctional coenzyme A synthase-like [Branchiostoma lanceolatum]|uniref:bifunctional coenzyme A synthase-like n=1 Tax=Branchiostoma lanceolatum TaxID=7740 RepID=UPI0034559176
MQTATSKVFYKCRTQIATIIHSTKLLRCNNNQSSTTCKVAARNLSNKTDFLSAKSISGARYYCTMPPTKGLYQNVCLGGTFDRMHEGHFLLLRESCRLCEGTLTVGVTDLSMIQSKILCELIEPVEVRIENVQQFLRETKPTMETDVVPISDPLGPAGWNPDIQAIVVSTETKKGADFVNETRKKKGLNELAVHIIDLVPEPSPSSSEESKVSSSNVRQRLLGTLLRPIQPKPDIRANPYVLGLTGGIASGKTAVARRLQGLGAAVVDCDKLGHKAYEPGTATHGQVVETFGQDVLAEDGTINRKVLGPKVFADKAKLQALNNIVWPEIARLAKAEIATHAEAGKSVVVLDAAVLLEAGWESFCHEIWVSLIPRKEAIKRIVDRNKFTEEDAARRIDSQMSNQERVDSGNVIISTLWEPEVTQKQVEKAWSLLQDRIQQTAEKGASQL